MRLDRVWFRLGDARDENGNSLRLRVTYFDLTNVQREIVTQGLFREFGESEKGLFPFYLAKNLSTTVLSERNTLTRALLIIQICRWLRTTYSDDVTVRLFLEWRPWFSAIRSYGTQQGVEINSFGRSLDIRNLILFFLSPALIARIRFALTGNKRLRAVRRKEVRSNTVDRAVLAVQHHSYFNLDEPECYSDLFFWQNSKIPGKEVLPIFWMPQVPIDGSRLEQLVGHNISGVAIDPRCSWVPEVPVYLDSAPVVHGILKRLELGLAASSHEQKSLNYQLLCYRERCQYWTDLFETFNVRVHVTWYWADGEHVLIAEALGRLGGVTAVYQRSLELISASEMAIATDLFFGFSHESLKRQVRNGSRVTYSIVTGYLGDHRFPLLRTRGAEIRDRLHKNGARHILAFFDEDSSDDQWDIGYEYQRENYAFLLEKVIEHEWFGLVLKPKLPMTFRSRLGAVSELLSRAIRTNRCFVIEGGPLESKFPPAVAALASDVAVNGHLCAPTAGFEAALAGIPTLLMDREGWNVSPLYELGVGRVVFNSWDDLWRTFVDHRLNGNLVPGFGDWSSILDSFDPFRDGRAAERMGNYLHWVLDGLKAGKTREIVLADSAERYCAKWGYDKVQFMRSEFVSN